VVANTKYINHFSRTDVETIFLSFYFMNRKMVKRLCFIMIFITLFPNINACAVGYSKTWLNDGVGGYTCIPCSPGSYGMVNNGQGVCLTCPGGTYSNTDSATVCQDCGAGKYQTPNPNGYSGGTSCTLCAAGSYSASGWHICQLCQAGKFSEPGKSECQDCSPGKYSPQGQANSCLFCEDYYTSDTSASACYAYALCRNAANTTEEQKAEYCTEDDRGHPRDEPACPKNQYVHDNVASDTITLCEWCNQSTYSRPWSESNGCLTCTSNLYDSDFDEQCMSGQKPLNNVYTRGCGYKCSACSEGKYLFGNECVDCLIGTYRDDEDPIESCKMCRDLEGFSGQALFVTTLETKSTSNLCVCKESMQMVGDNCKCPAGTYLQSASHDKPCTPVPFGTFTNSPNRFEKPIPCPVDTNTTSTGSQSIQDCLCGNGGNCAFCRAGEYYVMQDDQIECYGCAPGKYSPAPGYTACISCALAEYQIRSNQSYCNACNGNEYAEDGVTCLLATADSLTCQLPFVHTDKTLSFDMGIPCLACMEGYVATRSTSYECNMCASGKFHNISNNSCDECPHDRPYSHNASFSIEHCFQLEVIQDNQSQISALDNIFEMIPKVYHDTYGTILLQIHECPYYGARDSLWNVPESGVLHDYYNCKIHSIPQRPSMPFVAPRANKENEIKIHTLTGASSYPFWFEAFFVNVSLCTENCISVSDNYIIFNDVSGRYGPFYFTSHTIPLHLGVWFDPMMSNTLEVYQASKHVITKYQVTKTKQLVNNTSLLFSYTLSDEIMQMVPFYSPQTESTVMLFFKTYTLPVKFGILNTKSSTIGLDFKRNRIIALSLSNHSFFTTHEWSLVNVYIREDLRIFLSVKNGEWHSFYIDKDQLAFYLKTAPIPTCKLEYSESTNLVCRNTSKLKPETVESARVEINFEYIGSGECRNVHNLVPFYLFTNLSSFEECRMSCLDDTNCSGFSYGDACKIYFLSAKEPIGKWNLGLLPTLQVAWVFDINSTFSLNNLNTECYRKPIYNYTTWVAFSAFELVGFGHCMSQNQTTPHHIYSHDLSYESCRSECLLKPECSGVMYLRSTHEWGKRCYLYFSHAYNAPRNWVAGTGVQAHTLIESVLIHLNSECYRKNKLFNFDRPVATVCNHKTVHVRQAYCHEVHPKLSITSHCSEPTKSRCPNVVTNNLTSGRIQLPLNANCTYVIEATEKYAIIHASFSNLPSIRQHRIFLSAENARVHLENSGLSYEDVIVNVFKHPRRNVTIWNSFSSVRIESSNKQTYDLLDIHFSVHTDYAKCEATFVNRTLACSQCPYDTFRNTRCQQICTECSANSYYTGFQVDGVHECACKPPYRKVYDDNGNIQCKMCDAGKYLFFSTDMEYPLCRTCPSFSSSPEGYAISCQCTETNHYFNQSEGRCRKCNEVHDKESLYCGACNNCTCDGYGMHEFGGADNPVSVCALCAPGKYATANMEQCVPCDDGTYATEYGSSSCFLCPSNQTRTDGFQGSCPSFERLEPLLSNQHVTTTAQRSVHSQTRLRETLSS